MKDLQGTSGSAWQDAAGRKWVRLQARTDAQLAPFGHAAQAALEVTAGERVLDVGCGAGQTLLELSERVGSNGQVVGVDVSEPLLARARERVDQSGLGNVELLIGDAAEQRFERPFDAVFSRFGVMFFDESAEAFRNLHAALRPGGRLGFVCWQSLHQNPWAQRLLEAVQVVAPGQPVPDLLALDRPGPFYFAKAEFVEELLSGAGFEDVCMRPLEIDLWFGGARTLDEAVEYALDIGPAARFVADGDPERLPEFTRALREAIEPFLSERGVWFPSATWIVTARRA